MRGDKVRTCTLRALMPSRVAFWRLSTSLDSMRMGMDGALRIYHAVATLIALSLRSFGLSLTSAFM